MTSVFNIVVIIFVVLIIITCIFFIMNMFMYPQQIGDGKEVFYFYLDTCPYCQTFTPTWEKFSQYVKNNLPNVRTTMVNCDNNSAMCQNISGVPFISMKYNNQTYTYNGQKTVDGLVNFVNSFK